MKSIFLIITFLVSTIAINAQKYQFKTAIDIDASSVKSQGQTGTCWSFSTSSFIESEIYRLTNKHVDISEMFSVRNTYDDKAWNYVMRQGKLQFSQGGLAHDVMNSIRDNGLVTESSFSGLFFKPNVYNHSKIVPQLKMVLDSFIKNDKHSKYPDWKTATSAILDKEIGKTPTKVTFKNNSYSPKSFAKMLKINPDNYITLTSFTQHPFYSDFVLNIPDNFSNGSMYNVPIEELVSVVDYALKKGFTIALDVDVSEKTFSAKNGIAVLPKNSADNELSLTELVPEMKVTQDFRQVEFENYNTTDDHLMHIVGMVKDQKGNNYYKVKNSWGSNSKRIGNNGFIYMSVPYFKLKTISVLLHNKGLSKKVKKKFHLKS